MTNLQLTSHNDPPPMWSHAWFQQLDAALTQTGQALVDFGVALGWLPSPEEIARQQRIERHMARCARRRGYRRKGRK